MFKMNIICFGVASTSALQFVYVRKSNNKILRSLFNRLIHNAFFEIPMWGLDIQGYTCYREIVTRN